MFISAEGRRISIYKPVYSAIVWLWEKIKQSKKEK